MLMEEWRKSCGSYKDADYYGDFYLESEQNNNVTFCSKINSFSLKISKSFLILPSTYY